MTHTQELLQQRDDLEQDLRRLTAHGRDQVDVVAFTSIADMGPPLDVSETTRHKVYQLVMADLQRRLGALHEQLYTPMPTGNVVRAL